MLPWWLTKKPEKFYENASIELTPSIWRTNGPYAILEAMSYGLCVIASDEGGIKEQIIDMETGLLFEQGNEGEFKEKLDYLLKNPREIRRLGKNARKYVKENFDWHKIVKRYEKTYEMAIKDFK